MTLLQLLVFDVFVTFSLVTSLSLIVSKTGLWPVGHIGAAALGQLLLGVGVVHLGFPTAAATGLALLAGGAVAWGIGRASRRLRGDSFLILSLALLLAVRGAALELLGPGGASGFQPLLPGVEAWSATVVCAVAPAVAIGFLLRGAGRPPLERVLAAVRQDEHAALALGVAGPTLRGLVVTVGTVCALGVGTLASVGRSLADPGHATLSRGLLLLAAVVIGGLDSVLGCACGTLLVVALPRLSEAVFNETPWSDQAVPVSDLVLALAMLVVMRRFPRGLAGRRDWSPRGS